MSPNLTTYSQSANSGATETIALGKSIGVTQAAYNDVNELVSLAPGGGTFFQGTTDKPAKSTTLNTQVLSIQAKAPSSSTFSTEASSAAGESWSFAYAPAEYASGTSINATLSGTVRAGDVINLTFYEVRLPGGSYTVSYTVQSGDTIASIISGIAFNINHVSPLQFTYGISAFNWSLTTLYLGDNSSTTTGPNSFALSASAVGVATETLTSSTTSDQNLNITVGGTVTTNDVVSLTVENANLTNGQETASYTVNSMDTLSTIASGLASAVNADTHLQAIGVGASSSAAVVSVTTDTSYTESVTGSATETITLGTNNRGNTTATIGGSPTTGDVLSITAHNQSLSGGSESASYTVLSTDTLLTIANGLAAAINADAHLQTLGVSAPADTATQAFSQAFNGTALLPTGASTASVTAIDGSSNTKTNNYQLSATGTPSTSLAYDKNGNMTGDGTNSYQWDCENRLIQINYPGSGNYSAFSYDSNSHIAKINESSGATKQFVWCVGIMSEARDGSGNVLNQYFCYGQTISGNNYFYTQDLLASIRELTDSSGNIQARYSFDPYGRATKLQGTLSSDFQYAGYYIHAPSGLNLTSTRPFDSQLGRWLNRDSIGESGGINLYGYVGNEPEASADPLGLIKWSENFQKFPI